MSNFNEAFMETKQCFGQFEDEDVSWHCKGCLVRGECKAKVKENENEQS